MSTNDHSAAIEQELTLALDELASALDRAGKATSAIRSIVPRLAAAGSVLDEIEALVRSGRNQLDPEISLASEPMAYPRPTLVVPNPAAPRPKPPARRKLEPGPADAIAALPPSDFIAVAPAETPALQMPDQQRQAGVTCFRLEFESMAGPLDLRAVDDAVSEHPAVRDVALLDYDGRHATLKVWIDATSTPAEIQNALKQRAAEIFAGGHDLSIVALEDVA